MEQNLESPSTYYNKYKKRSFFFSRLTVMASMLVLVVTLGINISLLYSHDKNTIHSEAASTQNPQNVLPSLPPGCIYHQIKGGLAVVCPTPTPTITAAVPINIVLPQLPAQCHLATSTGGNEIHCTTAVPIPTVPVTLPATCRATSQTNAVLCKNAANENVTVPLPALPKGCSYTFNRSQYFVNCEAK